MTADNTKPIRLGFKSYLKIIRNSVGSNLFRNLYVHTDDKGDFDALDDGNNSCAFFVSAILVLFKKVHDIHGTIESTVKDLQESGWVEVKKPQPGDVIVWEKRQFKDGIYEHVGFSIGNGRAISTSLVQKTPVEHDQNFESEKRRIIQIFRYPKWD